MIDDRWEKLMAWEKETSAKIAARRTEAEKLSGDERTEAILETMQDKIALLEEFMKKGYGCTLTEGFSGREKPLYGPST